MPKLTRDEVLRYRKGRMSQETVRRHFLSWRSEQAPPIPLRCDNPRCAFHTTTPIWNGVPIKLILDHVNGVCGDNRPDNLQLLCPNCNSQQATHGGGNKGKVIQSEGGFANVRPDGKKDYFLPAEPGKFRISANGIE